MLARGGAERAGGGSRRTGGGAASGQDLAQSCLFSKLETCLDRAGDWACEPRRCWRSVKSLARLASTAGAPPLQHLGAQHLTMLPLRRT